MMLIDQFSSRQKLEFENASILSFDIFDTLILRKVYDPHDVFSLTESIYNTKNRRLEFPFRTERIKSERDARQLKHSQKQTMEINLEEIYHQLMQTTGIGQEIAAKLKQLEIEAEKLCCYANPYLFPFYQYCLTTNKTIILTTDMYLTREIIEALLNQCGYDQYSSLYISNELEQSKGTGLFSLVLQNENILANQLFHIGDNLDSDYKSPKQLGISAFYYPKPRDRANESDYFKKNLLSSMVNLDHSLAESIHLSQLIHKYFAHPTGYSALENEDRFWYNFGYINAGILTLGFIQWIVQNIVIDQVEHLYFFSRDGYIMQKIYNLYKEYHPGLPDSHYMYTSRNFFYLACITSVEDIMDRQTLFGTNEYMTIKEILLSLELDPSLYVDAIKECGFQNDSEIIYTVDRKNNSRLYQLFNRLISDIRDKAAEKRNIILSYLKQIDFFSYKKVGVVDIGWNGSIQLFLQEIFKLEEKVSNPMIGYYLNLVKKESFYQQNKMEVKALFYETKDPYYFLHIFVQSFEIFELIFTANHGRVRGLKKMNQQVEPIYEQDPVLSTLKHVIHQIHQGIIDYNQDATLLYQLNEIIPITKQLSIHPIKRVLFNPDQREASKLGYIRHDVRGFGEDKDFLWIARPDPLYRYFLNPLRLYYHLEEALWRTGFLKNLFHYKIFIKPITLLMKIVRKLKRL